MDKLVYNIEWISKCKFVFPMIFASCVGIGH